MNRRPDGGRCRLAACLGLALVAGMAGCQDRRTDAEDAPQPRVVAPATRQESSLKLAFSHDLTIALAARAIAPHFEAARERCLKDDALRCVLVQSSIRSGSGSGPLARPSAQIQVRLPHEAVGPYVAFLTAPLPGEKAADVVLRELATRAEDLTRATTDTARRLSHLNDYRDRLTALSRKEDVRVEELVKIASEQSQVQAQIEEFEAKRRGLDERVDTEIISVSFRSEEAQAGLWAPVSDAWARSGRILGESTGSALRFAVASLPWLPIAAIGLLILRAVWRRRRGRPSANPIPIDGGR